MILFSLIVGDSLLGFVFFVNWTLELRHLDML